MGIFSRGSAFDKRGFGMVAKNHGDGAKKMGKGSFGIAEIMWRPDKAFKKEHWNQVGQNFRQGAEQSLPGDLGHDEAGRDRGNFFKGSLAKIDSEEQRQNYFAALRGDDMPYSNQPITNWSGLQGGPSPEYMSQFTNVDPNTAQTLNNIYQQVYAGGRFNNAE